MLVQPVVRSTEMRMESVAEVVTGYIWVQFFLLAYKLSLCNLGSRKESTCHQKSPYCTEERKVVWGLGNNTDRAGYAWLFLCFTPLKWGNNCRPDLDRTC